MMSLQAKKYIEAFEKAEKLNNETLIAMAKAKGFTGVGDQ